MVADHDSQLYKDMADLRRTVPKLQNEITSLKKRLTKLTSRVESIELMAFQDQISKLGDEVKSINEDLTKVARVVALNEIDTLNLHMLNAIRKEISEGHLRERLTEYMAVECAQVRERVVNAPSPLDTLAAFRKECTSYSDKYNLGAFITKP